MFFIVPGSGLPGASGTTGIPQSAARRTQPHLPGGPAGHAAKLPVRSHQPKRGASLAPRSAACWPGPLNDLPNVEKTHVVDDGEQRDTTILRPQILAFIFPQRRTSCKAVRIW